MADFNRFKRQVQEQFKLLQEKGQILQVAVDRDALWNAYLSGFEGDDLAEHTCGCCRNFIQQAGSMVVIDDQLKLHTLWDFVCGETLYQKAIDALSEALRIINNL